jgi:hypothetical protein
MSSRGLWINWAAQAAAWFVVIAAVFPLAQLIFFLKSDYRHGFGLWLADPLPDEFYPEMFLMGGGVAAFLAAVNVVPRTTLYRWVRSKQGIEISIAILAVTYIFLHVMGFIGSEWDMNDPECPNLVRVPFVVMMLLFGVAFLNVFFRFLPAWWRNRQPMSIEKIAWLVVLCFVPEGLFVYWFFVFRHMDEQGQYAVL